MNVTPLDESEAMRLLRQVVAERPDYVYETPELTGVCVYVGADGCPSCLIGEVLFRWGVPIGVLRLLDDHPGGSSIDTVAGALVDHGYPITSAALRVLTAAQEAQDMSEPWSEALTRAENADDPGKQKARKDACT